MKKKIRFNLLKNNRVFTFMQQICVNKLSETLSLHPSRSHIYIFLCSILILFLFFMSRK